MALETNKQVENLEGGVVYCPVMEGVSVDQKTAEKSGWVREYKGKKYYFCCDACLESWDADPEYYAK